MRIVLLSTILLLGGCQLIDGPSFMPTGYKYQHEPYKSQPGPEPRHSAHHTHASDSMNASQMPEATPEATTYGGVTIAPPKKIYND